MKHILRAIVGPQAGAVIVLDRRATLGRAADCEIQIVHEGVSRQHAKFSVNDSGVVVTDLSSDNGTYVNDARIMRHVLRPGDTVRVMETQFVYELVADEARVETAAVFTRKVTSGDSLRRTGPVEILQAPGPRGSRRTPAAGRDRPTPGRAPKAMQERPLGDRPPAGSPNYEAGNSGMWRRSIEPAARPRPGPSVAELATHAPMVGGSAVPAATPSAASLRRADAFPGNSVVDAPPVTSGSGAFRRPESPSRGRGEPITGRYGADEVRAALEVEPERIVPPAARGGSAAVRGRTTRPTAEVPRHESAIEMAPEDPQPGYRFQPPGAAERHAKTGAYTAVPQADRAPADPREEPSDPVGAALPPGWVKVGPSRNAVDRIDGIPAPRARGATPGARGPSPSARANAPAAASSVAPTGEYSPPIGERSHAYTSGDADPLARGTDARAMEALAAELNRRTRLTPPPDDPHVGVESVDAEDGRSTLSAVLQYRDFRLRTLQGGRLTAVERRRYDYLDRHLQRTTVDGDALAAMRRFARFSCELPAELVHSHLRGTSTLAVAVYDLGAGGARLDVGSTGLHVGDVVYLSIDLDGVKCPPGEVAQRVVFKSRVVWTLGVELGVSFSGAPKYERALGS